MLSENDDWETHPQFFLFGDQADPPLGLKDSGIVTTLSEGEYVFHLMSSTNTDTGDIFHEVVDLGIPQVVENYAPHGLKALSGLEVEEINLLVLWLDNLSHRIRRVPLQYLMIREEEWTPWMVESRMTELEALSNDLTKSEDLENYSMEMAELEIKLARLESQDLFNLDSSGILRTEVVLILKIMLPIIKSG